MTKAKWQERFRKAMLKRKAELERVLASNIKEFREDENRAVEVVERAANEAADDLAAGLAEIESAQLAQIEQALRRLEEGTFGLCVECGKPIPQKRLQLLPFATHCIRCQRAQEQRKLRSQSGAYGQRGRPVA